MAYVNVAEWSPDQVAEWLKGLDDVLQPYIHLFVTKNINGNRLLNLAVDDFAILKISCIGHQEIILQGVDLLRNIHYQIHQENVQLLALRLSSKARSIYNELQITTFSDGLGRNYLTSEEEKEKEIKDDAKSEVNKQKGKKERVLTSVLSGVVDVLSSVKVLVSWLHRTPFHGIVQYDDLKSHFLDLSIRLATIAQRDSFAENPVSIVKEICLKLAEMADIIIQDSKDPLILQPAFLDVVTIKKRADDNWALGIYSSYHGVHQISMLRALSPAHATGKLMGGDQVVQVNYQTVVGWTSHKVNQLMQENPVQVILTVKKCPRHVNTITEIYLRPFRLPSKKRTYSPWMNNNISSQRYDLQSIPNLQFIKSYDGKSASQRPVNIEVHPKTMTPPTASLNSSGSEMEVITASESDSDEVNSDDLDDDPFMSDVDFGSGTPSLSGRLFQPKPRPNVRRRATIPGATARHTLPFDHLLQSFCHHPLVPEPIGDSLGDGFSKDLNLFRNKESPENSRSSRPHTCIGTEKDAAEKRRRRRLRKEKEQEREMLFIDESDENEAAKENQNDEDDVMSDNKAPNVSPNKVSPFFSRKVSHVPDSKESLPLSCNSPTAKSPPKSPQGSFEELRGLRKISDDRPKLDKSYSSPTYDLEDREAAHFLDRLLEIPPKSVPANEGVDENKQTIQEFVEDIDNKKETKPMEKLSSTSTSSPVAVLHHTTSDSFPSQDGTHLSTMTSLALSGIHMMTPTVLAISSHNSPYIQGSIGNDPAASDHCSSGVVCEPSSSEVGQNVPCTPEPLSKYVNMNKPLTSLSVLANTHTNNDYINCTQTATGDGTGDSKSGSNEHCPDGGGGGGCWGSGGGCDNPQDAKSDVDASLHSLSDKVVLRESKSRSPSSWRRGLIMDPSGSRRISCRDLGLGDHHGWLYLRKDSKGFLLSHRWEKRWFILKKSNLYGYRDKDAPKADSLIYLPGFHVCPASDVKSKRFAFKIYHSSGATFYFACDTSEERSRWMSQMGLMSAIPPVTEQSSHEKDQGSPEAYYSETDDELEKSPSMQRSPLSPSNRISPTKERLQVAKTKGPSVGSRASGPSPNSRISPLGSLTSLTSGRQGLRFLHSPKGVMSRPLPTQNFRSYVRVRDPLPNTPTSPAVEYPVKGGGGEKIESEGKEGKGVRRKGSLRERLRHLPASLTLDRRKNQKRSPPSREDISLKATGGSKSETSLLDPSRGGRVLKGDRVSSKSSSQLPSYMRPTHASSLHTEGDAAPLSVLKGVARTASIGGLSVSSSSLRSLSPRRGSLDCLISKGMSPPVSPGRSTTGSTGSIAAQEEYREGSPEKLWINSLRSPIRPTPPVEKEADRLKRTVNYQPIARGRGDSMQLAFELSLSGTPKKSTVGKKPAQRPQVPPRTKFLSPSERLVSSPPPTQTSPPLVHTPFRSKAPPNLTLTSSPQEDSDSPKTPLKPTMGVLMIGKQRRAPGVISPREVLPEYFGMEYPPTFEPESYTLNLPSDGVYGSPSPSNQKEAMDKSASLSPQANSNSTGRTQAKSSSSTLTNPGYINISHVSNTMAELKTKSYHHSIYVTSPCKESADVGERKTGNQPPPVPPNKPSRGIPPLTSPTPRPIIQPVTFRRPQRLPSPSAAGATPSSGSESPLDDSSCEYVTMSSPNPNPNQNANVNPLPPRQI